MNERRTQQQIYYDIMTAIISIQKKEKLKPTVIQLRSKLAYNKCRLYLDRMIRFQLIKNNYKITKKGHNFYEQFTEIIHQVNNLESMLGMNVNLPIPTKLTIDGLEFIQDMSTALDYQVKLSKAWIKFQKEIK